MRKEMRERGMFIVTKELSWDRDKISRIELQLEARYANNLIYHKIGGTMGDLEHELLRFPSGVHDDIIDALQGACQLLKNPRATKSTAPAVEDPNFELLRKLAIEQRQPWRRKKQSFQYGKKTHLGIPARKTLW